jgi:hypothetical protein
MSDSFAPPPPDSAAPPSGGKPLSFELAPPGGLKKLLGKKGPSRLTLTPAEIVVEHAQALRRPLRFAPGSVAVADVDPGPGSGGKDAHGRFPILHRLGPTQVVPRSEGIMGWLWTSEDASAFTVLGDDAPNLVLVFSPPLSGAVVQDAFEPAELAELAKRAPLGEPAVFGLLLRAERAHEVREALDRYGLLKPLTDREVPPVQRRHLPGDKEANPSLGARDAGRSETSVPPPGRS